MTISAAPKNSAESTTEASRLAERRPALARCHGEEDEMENPRTESARDHDDSDIIDNAERAPSQGGRSGGNLQSDVATDASLERVRDPQAMEGVDKQDDIDHAQRYAARHPADKSSGGGPSE
jgi:hypothetical protein